MKTIIHYNIDEIDEGQWNRLARDSSVFYDYGWFKTFHNLLGTPAFIAAYCSGTLVGLMPGFIVSDPETYLYHNHKNALFCRNEVDFTRFMYRTKKMKLWAILKLISKGSKILEPLLNRMLFPAYICVSPRGFIGDMLYESEEVAQSILSRLDTLCNEQHIKTRCALWVSKENERLASILTHCGFKRLVGELDFKMELNWNSIEKLMDNLISVRRRRYKRDMNKLNRKCYLVEYHKGDEFILNNIDELTSLARKHAFACGDILNEKDLKDTFVNLCTNMKDTIYQIVARRDKTIIGFSIGLRKNERLYPKFEGYDPVTSEAIGLHYNLGYYHHIIKGIEDNAQRICLGAGDPESKLTRGFRPTELLCYYRFNIHPLFDKLLAKYLAWVNNFKMNAYDSISGFKAWKST